MQTQAGAKVPKKPDLSDVQFKRLEDAFTAGRKLKAVRAAITEEETRHKRQMAILNESLALSLLDYEQRASELAGAS